MQNFSEAEIQLLIALLEVASPKETPNNNFYRFYPSTLDQAATYFRKFRLPWNEAYTALLAKGLLQQTQSDHYQLTENGVREGERWRAARPPIWYWYQEYYAEAPYSPTYTQFCQMLYGRYLCQTNFSDMAQLHRLLNATMLGTANRVLDLGCGIGMIAEYISDTTGAFVTGMDYIPEAIELARQRTMPKALRLHFQIGNLDTLLFPPHSFDTLISIDTLYMPNDLEDTLGQMRTLLQPGGQMAIFYSHMIGDAEKNRESLQADRTPLGQALGKAGLPYRVEEFTAETYAHLQRKHHIGQALHAAFVAEGREFLYHYIMAESESNLAPYDPATCKMSRFLYLVKC